MVTNFGINETLVRDLLCYLLCCIFSDMADYCPIVAVDRGSSFDVLR